MKKKILCLVLIFLGFSQCFLHAMEDENVEIQQKTQIVKSQWGHQDIGCVTAQGKKTTYISAAHLFLGRSPLDQTIMHAAVVFEGYGPDKEVDQVFSNISPGAKQLYQKKEKKEERWAIGFDLRKGGIHIWNYKSIEERLNPDYKTADGDPINYTPAYSTRILSIHARKAILIGARDAGANPSGCSYQLCSGLFFQKICRGKKNNCATYCIKLLRSAEVHIPLCVNRVCLNVIPDFGIRSCIFGSLETLQAKIPYMKYKKLNKLNNKLGYSPLPLTTKINNCFMSCW